ncbi:hypothetical protein F183_A16460 [Bryobacterales bacterium F-183]|nr:hypothetical protein F183_A16460 [Bryobacterales bacterium F-183]
MINSPYQRLVQFQQMTEAEPLPRLSGDRGDEFTSFGMVMQAVVRRWKGIAAGIVLGLAAGGAFAFLQTPIYRANAILELQIPNEDFLNRREVDPNSDGGPLQAEPYLQTQLKLIESDGLLWSAANKSGLLLLPEFRGASRAKALEAIHGALSVKLAGQTRIVDVAFESTSPSAAAEFTNQLTHSYREMVQGRRMAAARQTASFLESQIADRKAKADASQEKLTAYVKKHGMPSIDRESAAEMRLRDLQAALAQAEAARAHDQSLYEEARKATAEAASDSNDHEALRNYRVRLMELRAKRAEAAQIYQPGHYKVKQLDAEIAEVDAGLQRERTNLQNRLLARYQASNRKEALLREEVSRQAVRVSGQASYGVTYQSLKSELERTQTAYDEASRKFQEANSSASVITDNVQILDPAQKPERPVRPKRTVAVALGLFAGMIFGCLFALGRESRDRRLEAQARATAELGVPQLGAAPPAWIDAGTKAPKDIEGIEASRRYALWNWTNPGSRHAEAYRSIATSLIFACERRHDGHLRVAVTSANFGEGRTTAAVSIATAMAETGCRILLIDANRQSPSLHEIFGTPADSGFFSAIAAEDGLSTPVFATDVTNLYVMPAGPAKDKMLDVGSLRKVMADLRDTYDVIVIDAPPVLGHSDARWLARATDGAVLIHNPQVSSARDMEAAVSRLYSDRIHILGSVLNQWHEQPSLANLSAIAGYQARAAAAAAGGSNNSRLLQS